MNRTVWRSVALAVLPVGLAVGAIAQDKAKKSSHERLQPYWNQLDLTEEQRTQYDRVVREYGPKIDDLEAQLEALKDRRRKAWQAILTADQKRKLESMQAQRGKKKAADEKGDEADAKPPTKTVRKPVGDAPEEEAKPTKKKPKRGDG
jgi:hypothetical protein